MHQALFPNADSWRDEALEADWSRLLDMRAAVNAKLEGARQRKEIGNALSAEVTIAVGGDLADLLARYAADLPMLFITSAVRLVEGAEGDPSIAVAHAAGEKCPRCWRYVPVLTATGTIAGICERCEDAVGARLGHAN